MDIDILSEDLENIINVYAARFDIDKHSDWSLLKLTEEVGELTQSYLKYSGQARTKDAGQEELRMDMEDELADVLGMALLFAKHHGIDVQQAITRKWLCHLDNPQSI